MSKQETLDQFDLCQFVELCICIGGCCWRIKQFTESTRYVIDTESPRSWTNDTKRVSDFFLTTISIFF